MGTKRLRTNFVLSSDRNAIVPLICFLFACLDGEWSGTIAYRSTFRITFLFVPFLGTERLYLKRSRLNTTLQRSTFRNNTE